MGSPALAVSRLAAAAGAGFPSANNVCRVADLVGDVVGYPAPWRTLPPGRLPPAGEVPRPRRPLHESLWAGQAELPFRLLQRPQRRVKALPLDRLHVSLRSTSASATSTYIRDMSRGGGAGNDQVDPCWILIPPCKNSHAQPRGPGLPAGDLLSCPGTPHARTCPPRGRGLAGRGLIPGHIEVPARQPGCQRSRPAGAAPLRAGQCRHGRSGGTSSECTVHVRRTTGKRPPVSSLVHCYARRDRV